MLFLENDHFILKNNDLLEKYVFEKQFLENTFFIENTKLMRNTLSENIDSLLKDELY